MQRGHEQAKEVWADISGRLAKLKEEGAAEAGHKEWCDKELMDNKHKRNKKTMQTQTAMKTKKLAISMDPSPAGRDQLLSMQNRNVGPVIGIQRPRSDDRNGGEINR